VVKPTSHSLTPEEQLVLHQLLQVKLWQDRLRVGAEIEGGIRPHAITPPISGLWNLTHGVSLHPWQEECVDAWFANRGKGIVKVVTGAGKTLLALALAERLQHQAVPALRLAVVVPTVVLLNQWREEFRIRTNVPAEAIATMGAGQSGSFAQGVRVVLAVLSTAARKLPENVAHSGIANDLLLIVDECHRAGAPEMRRVLATPRAYSLGLSATPERDDEVIDPEAVDSLDKSEDNAGTVQESVLVRELGDVVYEMTYSDAIRLQVLPSFRVVHYGLSLEPDERQQYEKISEEIRELRRELETPTRRGLALIRWCRSKAGAKDPRAVRLISLASDRKRLLFRMAERSAAVVQILKRRFRDDPAARAILFHESIEEVMALFFRLRSEGFRVVAEHSELPDAMRAESVRLFKTGLANVIVSARSLIEGFNVPSADLGIVVAASASVRQRVQTLGRLLRRAETARGDEKRATLHVLYAKGTADEFIYEKVDWEAFVGSGRSEYFVWPSVAHSDPIAADGPPRIPRLDESEIDSRSISPGDVYPGDPDVGEAYSVDATGTVRDEEGNLINATAELQTAIGQSMRFGGRFRVTPRQGFILKIERDTCGWRAIYLGRLASTLERIRTYAPREPLEGLKPGDSYPLDRVRGQIFAVLQRDERLIARKTRKGVRFVVPASKISDQAKRAALLGIQAGLKNAYTFGHRISKITVTSEGHVVYLYGNTAYFLGYAPEGPAGFILDEAPSSS
jgi:superfamily II DNA or RNA helicase